MTVAKTALWIAESQMMKDVYKRQVYARSYIMGGESGMTADVQKNADGSALTEVTNPDGVQYITIDVYKRQMLCCGCRK